MTVADDLATLRIDHIDTGIALGHIDDADCMPSCVVCAALARVEAEIARLERHPDAWSQQAFDQQKARAEAAEAEVARLKDGLRDAVEAMERMDAAIEANSEAGTPDWFVAAEQKTRALLAEDGAGIHSADPTKVTGEMMREAGRGPTADDGAAHRLAGENGWNYPPHQDSKAVQPDGAACDHGITLQNRETGRERCAECGAIISGGAA